MEGEQDLTADIHCYPITILPHTSALFRDYTDVGSAADAGLLRRWYPTDPFTMGWAGRGQGKGAPELTAEHRERLAEALKMQVESFSGGAAALENVERLRRGAAAVVSGQQVGLFGGPLLTLLKAATAIRKAQDATRQSGREHVPVFWLASEDHDVAEVDQISLLSKAGLETLRLGVKPAKPVPVGAIPLNLNADGLAAALERATELLEWTPAAEVLRECYGPGETLAGGFGKLLTRVFEAQGLVVMDAASREFHRLGAPVLRYALEHAEELEHALLERTRELEAAGYHAQVLVVEGHSLLFLIDAETGARLPLRRSNDGTWRAGQKNYTLTDLLTVLEAEPERLSANALLRPVFQDCILPTAAYVGGPAEVAYFAQSAVVYERALGRVTPVLPRLSATLVEPSIGKVMAQHELELPQIFEAKTVEGLAQRLGARAMPIESKRRLAAAGNAMDTELTALAEYMQAMSPDLGRAAGVSASKMRYQMGRLRRLAATFELQREASLSKHAEAVMRNIFPDGHPQERLIAGIWFLARYGDGLPQMLVEHAGQECPGHRVIFL